MKLEVGRWTALCGEHGLEMFERVQQRIGLGAGRRRLFAAKPRAGLLVEAAFKWHVDLDHSFVVSDKWQDSEAARTAGCTSLLVASPWNGQAHHDFVLPDLDAIVDKIHQLKDQFTIA